MDKVIKQIIFFISFLFLSTVFGRSEDVRVKIIRVEGNTFYTMFLQKPMSLDSSVTLPVGASIQTGSNGEVAFNAVPGIDGLLKSGSDLRFHQLDMEIDGTTSVTAVVFELTVGSLIVDVHDLAPDSFFEVRTPQGNFRTKEGKLFISFDGIAGRVFMLGGDVMADIKNRGKVSITSGNVIEIVGVEPDIPEVRLIASTVREVNIVQESFARMGDMLQQGQVESIDLDVATQIMTQNSVVSDFIPEPVIQNAIIATVPPVIPPPPVSPTGP
jgi:hypothetical protein